MVLAFAEIKARVLRLDQRRALCSETRVKEEAAAESRRS